MVPMSTLAMHLSTRSHAKTTAIYGWTAPPLTESASDHRMKTMAETNENAEELVTIASFLDPTEAQMARGALESAGIGSFLVGENANILNALAIETALQVRREDEPAATRILDSVAPRGASTAAELEDEATRNK